MLKKNCLESRILKKISCKKREVFIRADFEDISSDYDQIGRALKKLVQKGILIRVGYGLYTKAMKSSISDKVIPRIGMNELGKQCLKRLFVSVSSTVAEEEYNKGLSTQFPTGRVIGIKGRFSRKITINGISLVFEKAQALKRNLDAKKYKIQPY